MSKVMRSGYYLYYKILIDVYLFHYNRLMGRKRYSTVSG